MKRRWKFAIICSVLLAGGVWYEWTIVHAASSDGPTARLYSLTDRFENEKVDQLELVDASLAQAVDALNRRLDARSSGKKVPHFRVWNDGDPLPTGMHLKQVPEPEPDNEIESEIGVAILLDDSLPPAFPSTESAAPEIPGLPSAPLAPDSIDSGPIVPSLPGLPSEPSGIFRLVAVKKGGGMLTITATIQNAAMSDIARHTAHLFRKELAADGKTICFYPPNKLAFDVVERRFYLLNRGQAKFFFDIPDNAGRARIDMTDWFKQNGVGFSSEGNAYYDPRGNKFVIRGEADQVESAAGFFSGGCTSATAANSAIERLDWSARIWWSRTIHSR